MMRRTGRRWSTVLAVLGMLAFGAQLMADDCPMHAVTAGGGVHAGHGGSTPQEPPVPCDCAKACVAQLVFAVPPCAAGFHADVGEIPWHARPATEVAPGLVSQLRLPFATAPPRG